MPGTERAPIESHSTAMTPLQDDTRDPSMTESQEKTLAVTHLDWKPDRQVWLVISGQIVVALLPALDSTILVLSLPTVAQALHANAVQSYWMVSSYLLASGVAQPTWASLADVFGRRATFFSTLLIFTFGTVICCSAHTVGQMIAGRTFQGIGGGGIFGINQIIFSDIIPLRQRSKYFGYLQLATSMAVNLGPLIGASFIKVTWRWIFYINFPICGIGLAIVPFLLRYVQPKTTFYDKLSSIDWVGNAIFIVGLTAFLLGVSWGGNQFSWASAATLVPLILGIIIVVGAITYERYGTSAPFLRLSLFRTRSDVALYICVVLANLTLFSELYFLSLFLLAVKVYSPIISAIVLLGFGLTITPVSGFTGALITKLGSCKWGIWIGWTINTFGCGSLMILSPDLYVPGMIFVLLSAGTGQGLLFMSHQVASQASCRKKDAGYASGMFSFCRSLGFCLGLALGGTIFQNFLRYHLAQLHLPSAIAGNAEGYTEVLRAMPDGLVKTTIVEAYEWAFRYLFATMTGISGLGLVLSFVIDEHSLDVELDATHKLRSSTMLRAESRERDAEVGKGYAKVEQVDNQV